MAENGSEQNSKHERFKPGTWKPWLVKQRYSNPSEWDFRILKKTSFTPYMMANMMSKYWNQPQTKKDGQEGHQREIKKEREEDTTLNNGCRKSESVNMTENRDQNRNGTVPEEPCYQNNSDAVQETREFSEVLSHDQLQNLKQAPKDQIRILWIGHASLLIQMEGKNILTDPIFSHKAGPQNRIGYSRYRKPAVTIQMLKNLGEDFRIHAVLISHNHYDHFDKKSVQDLNKAFSDIKWFVPENLTSDLTYLGCGNVQEANWWGRLQYDEDITFHFTPAKHWSGRNPTDWYTSLWGSWIIESKSAKVFFAGDTGYEEELFQAIKEEFHQITVAALPIGAYEPREMMKCQHINPEEAVHIHKILGAKKSIGIHWRTFQLSCEGIDQPKSDLEKAKHKHGVKNEDFITLEKDLIATIDCKQLVNPQPEGSKEDLHTPD